MVAKKRAHKTQVLILQMYQGSELGSLRYDSDMIRAHDSGYDSETHLFLNSGALLLESLFPTVNLLRLLLCQWLQWLDLPDDLGQDLNMKNVKISMRIYDLYPPACRRLFWMFFSCTFSSATLRLMFLFDGVLVWLPASRSQSHPPHQPHQQHSN